MRSSRKFYIQFQPDLVGDLDLAEWDAALSSELVDFSVSSGDEKGVYINYDFVSENPKESWSWIEGLLVKNPSFRDSSIVCCEGSQGWDNYLLLSHFDKNEPLDEIKNH